MKQLILGLLVFAIFVSGCQKSDKVNSNASALPDNASSKPIASFKIINTVDIIHNRNTIMELWPLEFANNSINGDSYYWDFGDGKYSTDKIPADVFFAPCQRTVTITLTVKNSAGETSSMSQDYSIQCSRMAQPHTPVVGQY